MRLGDSGTKPLLGVIEDGDTIFLDSGSTTYPLAKYIKMRQQITVVTNSLLVVNELVDSEVDVLLIGGRL